MPMQVSNKVLLKFLELVPATRFSSKPAHKDTFGHYQHSENMPGFISEKERLGGKLNARSL
jgi:hypothetical protein